MKYHFLWRLYRACGQWEKQQQRKKSDNWIKKMLLLTFMSVNHMSMKIFNWNESLLIHRIHGKSKWKKKIVKICLCAWVLYFHSYCKRKWVLTAEDVFLQFFIFFFFLIIFNTIVQSFQSSEWNTALFSKFFIIFLFISAGKWSYMNLNICVFNALQTIELFEANKTNTK